MPIREPFNFVPLHAGGNDVFLPNWAKQISHEIPFSDGNSGIINLTITAETPIFVRNGHTKDEGQSKSGNYKTFSVYNKQYFIPSTSIKGAIRNVLEIMSFGKMRLDENAMFSFRDLRHNIPEYNTFIASQSTIHCGWLRFASNGTDYEILDCGQPYRIGQKEIDDHFETQVLEKTYRNTRIKKIEENEKTAKFKYELLKNTIYKPNIEYHFSVASNANEQNPRRVEFDSNGDIIGNIVFTGQPNKWMYPRPTILDQHAGKYYDFVFCTPTSQKEPIPVSKEKFNHFKFIYGESSEWEMVSKSMNSNGAPVFFRLDRNGEIEEVKDLGLAYLYKLPYQYSPYKLLNLMSDRHSSESPDLAECIFGFTNKKSSLRGRVQFSHAFSKNAKPMEEGIPLALSSPKASYYPIYLQQDGENGTTQLYKTYNNNVRLSGWKRYQIRNNPWLKSTGDTKIDTSIYPVTNGAVFYCKIRFHNLRAAELGSLLSTLTFHNTEGCYHQIGQGKPYGFGKVKVDAKLEGSLSNKEIFFMSEFENEISKEFPTWVQDPSIQELVTLAHEQVDANDGLYQYMIMSNNRDENEFNTAKTARRFLKKYSELLRRRTEVKTLCNESRMLKQLEKQIAEEILLQQEKDAALKIVEELKIKEESELLENRQQKIMNGLAFLIELNGNDNYKVNDFNGAKKRIEHWLSVSGNEFIPEDQIKTLTEALIRIYRFSNEKEKKNWYNFDESTIWAVVRKWVSTDFAKSIYNNLFE
jgi:CRISPR-associated protein (TIGR03986 family)